MNATEHGRKATIVWRVAHLVGLVTMAGMLTAVGQPEAANGIGIIVGAGVAALGGIVSTYAYSQGKVDVAESAHGPHPTRMSGSMKAVQ
jgi:hypothetical protein